jgi:hypothetical protein
VGKPIIWALLVLCSWFQAINALLIALYPTQKRPYEKLYLYGRFRVYLQEQGIPKMKTTPNQGQQTTNRQCPTPRELLCVRLNL